MARIHNLGYPRVGSKRELKFAQEAYWRGDIEVDSLTRTAQQLRATHWTTQARNGLDWVPVGDFSLYDHVLDTSQLLGHLPRRVRRDSEGIAALDQYFRVARGRSIQGQPVAAGEMTKWFDTNYHYIVPEFEADSTFELNPEKLLTELREAQAAGIAAKPVVLGPLSYLWLGKEKDDVTDRLTFLPKLLPLYRDLLSQLHEAGATWVQIDEPILVLDLPEAWQQSFRQTYDSLATAVRRPRVLLTTYFGPLGDNLELVTRLPVEGLHVDAVRGRTEVDTVAKAWPRDRVLSLGVIDGRNIWRSDLSTLVDWLKPLHNDRGDQLWLAPSCSLLHVPFSLKPETDLDPALKSWLAFADEKLDELAILGRALNDGEQAVAAELAQNAAALEARRQSTQVRNPAVQDRLAAVTDADLTRPSSYATRAQAQRKRFNLPLFPTTTIGSFPQTPEIRQARRRLRQGEITQAEYNSIIRGQIQVAVREQESYGLDVLVHGEAERNDMVEYFGEQLDGYAFTRFGWVQSYGSRCVKPPIIFGDVSRPHAMTTDWTVYAQSLTDQPMKGMLTGPITMLQWAFVRDDQPRQDTAFQVALALRDEVCDLANKGIGIIQVDEPAFREGLPLRQKDWADYLRWAADAFRLSTSGVADDVQIHTHMCYSEFNDIMYAIADLDADVITIETSRSDMELLDAFTDFEYPNEIGPGVYDIHSPNEPPVERMVELMKIAAQRLPAERLWVNPDCGLKTRRWPEVAPALRNLVAAARALREEHG